MKRKYLGMTTALVMACAIFAGGCGTTAGQADTQQMDTQQMDTQQMDTQQSETKTPDMQQNGAQQNETEQEDAGQMDTQKADAVEYEYTIEELMCQRDGNNIYGQIYVPLTEKSNKIPVVIIGHGLSVTYTNNVRFAETFAKHGIAAYIFDFCGGSVASKSDGSTKEMSVLTEKADMLAVFEEISKLDYVDTEQMFLMGESQGGLVASLCAAELSDRVKGLMLLYPAYNIPDAAKATFEGLDSIPEEYSLFGMTLGTVYYTDSQAIDVYSEIGKYEGPVTIYHGTDDHTVPIAYSQRALEVYPDAQLTEEEGQDHGFDASTQYAIAEELVSFIAE